MSDKELEKLLNKYAQSKSNSKNKDLQKLVSKNNNVTASQQIVENSKSKRVAMPKYAVVLIATLCIIVIAFSIAFPITYIMQSKNNQGGENNAPEDSITKVWTAPMAYEIAVKGGYTGTYEEFLQVFSNISTVKLDEEGNITLIFADGTEINAGKIEGNFNKGITSITVGENGDLIILYSDGSSQTLPSNIFKGEQGVGIKDMYIDENGYMIVILTDDTVINAGYVYQKETYTLELDAQGGYLDISDYGEITPVPEKTTYNKDDYAQLPVPIKKMYTFEGWYMIVDGKEVKVEGGIKMVSDIKLVAKWSGGPDYPKFTIPDAYLGTYVERNNSDFTMVVKSDVLECTLDGEMVKYYPVVIDGKTKVYMDNIYADMLVDMRLYEGMIIFQFQDQVTVFVRK